MVIAHQDVTGLEWSSGVLDSLRFTLDRFTHQYSTTPLLPSQWGKDNFTAKVVSSVSTSCEERKGGLFPNCISISKHLDSLCVCRVMSEVEP